jgi:hypothetical protein
LIRQLYNPKTSLYLEFKNYIFSNSFAWYYYSKSTSNDLEDENYFNIPFYGHQFLIRPEETQNKISKVNSQHLDTVSKIFLEIFEHNNIKVNYFLRINANCVHPFERVFDTMPHIDHPFEHKNSIIYLTNAGGSTIVGDEIFNPNEDDVIIFGGEKHYIQTPKKDRRVILVATFV